MKESPQKEDNISEYTLDKYHTKQDGTVIKSKY